MNKTVICNKALARVGDREYVEGSEQARACDLFFSDVVKEVLMAARWGFATRREVLRCEGQAHGGHLFHLPDDCLRLLEVLGVARFSLVEDRGLVVFEPMKSLEVDYITNEYFCDCHCCFPEAEVMFLNAVVVLLASRIAMSVAGDSRLAASLASEYRQIALPGAMTINKLQDSSNDQHPLRGIMRRSLFSGRRGAR